MQCVSQGGDGGVGGDGDGGGGGFREGDGGGAQIALPGMPMVPRLLPEPQSSFISHPVVPLKVASA